MWTYISFGIVLGLSAGLAPGPLTALVISQTLQHNAVEGIKVAAAPLLTDLPIILFVFLVFASLPEPDLALGIMSMLGGVFLLHLGYSSLRQQPVKLEVPAALPRSYLKGALVNALSPHPYLFWSAVGAPTVLKAIAESPAGAVGFVITFYVLLVGSKMAIAILAGKSRQLLAGSAYIWTQRALGAALIVFAVSLIHDGLFLTGAVPGAEDGVPLAD